MSDDKRYNPDDYNEDAQGAGKQNPDELPASTIFVEMMRQAAARRAAQNMPHATPQPPERSAEEEAAAFLPPSRRDRPPRRPTDSTPPATEPPAPPSEPPAATEPPRRNRAAPPDVAAPEFTTAPEPPAEISFETVERPPMPSRRPREEQRTSDTQPPEAGTAEQRVTDSKPPAPNDDPESEAMQEQRVRRVQRRNERRRKRRAGVLGGFLRTGIVVVIAALLTSTIFNFFTQPEFLNPEVASGLRIAQSTGVYTAQPTALPTPNWLRRVGVVSGHRGPENDPGAVCPDGLTEAEITFAVSQIVVKNLRAQGYSVDLLDEFDPRLDNYQAAALVSIHANTCQDFGQVVSGFLVAKAAARPDGGLDTLLAECIAGTYGKATGLERLFSLTVDMTDYHSFREIHPLTPASIIELGFLKDDRDVLTTQQDAMGQAITEGVLCFLQPRENPNGNMITATPGFVPSPTPTFTETSTPASG